MPPVLGYWNIRGLCEPIRLLLHHAGVEFEDKRIEFGPPPDYAYDVWQEEKKSLGLDFPNLPYYMDDDVKITQSFVIIRYLAKKHGLYPTSEKDILVSETLEQLSRDVTMAIFIFGHATGKMEGKKDLFQWRGGMFLEQISDFLGSNDWLVGDQLSYVDFLIYESADHYSYMMPDTYLKYPNLGGLARRIEALPNVRKYMEGGQYRVWPIYGPVASFGGSGTVPPRNHNRF